MTLNLHVILICFCTVHELRYKQKIVRNAVGILATLLLKSDSND